MHPVSTSLRHTRHTGGYSVSSSPSISVLTGIPAMSILYLRNPLFQLLSRFGLLPLIIIYAAMYPAKAQTATPTTHVCITEWSGWYGSTEDQFTHRFQMYRKWGVDTLRLETGWLNHPQLISALQKSNFRLKLIVYVLGITPEYGAAHPDGRMVDEHGTTDWHLGPWSALRDEVADSAIRTELRRVREVGLTNRVDEVVADLGPAGEGIFPANWTLNREGEEAFWCYSVAAQRSFIAAMQTRYGSFASAAMAWKLPGSIASSWNDFQIPKPGTPWARGTFWGDMLTWYRDSKRSMLETRVRHTLSIVRTALSPAAGVIVYLPGYAYSQAEWDSAISSASGAASIRLMMDNDWLMSLALKLGCRLQYTGAENATEVRRIVRKLRALGSNAARWMWAENAGVENAGTNPEWLADVAMGCGLRGIDFTWSSWLFDKVGVTPNDTAVRFAHATSAIREAVARGYAPIPVSYPGGSVSVKEGVYTLQCEATTRIMSSFPDEIKGGDPEIAAVSGGQEQRMLLRFPLQLLPAHSRIADARLVMKRYLTYADEGGTLPLEVFALTRAWSPAAAGWLEASDANKWGTPGGDVSLREGKPWAMALAPAFQKLGTTVIWDVTALARVQALGNNFGILIKLPAGVTGNKSFASSSHPDPTMRPVLEIKLTLQ